MKVLIFHIQGLLAFYEVLLGPGAQKRFQWRTKHEQKLRKTATISSHSFNLEFWIPQGDWIFPSQTEAWIACWICNEDAFGPLFCHKTKASKIQPLYVWSATGKAHRSRSDLTSSRSKDVFEMSEDEEDACVGPKVAAVSKPRHESRAETHERFYIIEVHRHRIEMFARKVPFEKCTRWRKVCGRSAKDQIGDSIFSFFFTISSERFAKGARKMRERRIHSSHVLPKMGCI